MSPAHFLSKQPLYKHGSFHANRPPPYASRLVFVRLEDATRHKHKNPAQPRSSPVQSRTTPKSTRPILLAYTRPRNPYEAFGSTLHNFHRSESGSLPHNPEIYAGQLVRLNTTRKTTLANCFVCTQLQNLHWPVGSFAHNPENYTCQLVRSHTTSQIYTATVVGHHLPPHPLNAAHLFSRTVINPARAFATYQPTALLLPCRSIPYNKQTQPP